ncbi:hypothetical protein [Microbacterium binotii]|uniref:Uncharacterized protein n=1 Tax=Microbacterium binotii TaxID=462710 RepID=A0ABN3PH50_9MICO
MKRVLAALLVLAAAVVAAVVSIMPASAASPGTGFGEWASSTRYGWHGSMAINGMHTYCIFPGRPLPTGDSVDNGLSPNAAGLDPQRLTAINMLVSTYGQTGDPVQAAAVAWAVKAIANWNESLHHFGYPGDTLQGAIDWVFRHVAPEHNGAVQNLAAAYYAEAMALPAGQMTATGSLQFATDAASPLRGTVTAVADAPGARGRITLQNAVFADTGAATRDDAEIGVAYDIVAAAPAGGTRFRVSGEGQFVGGFLPLVRHFTTPGGQDTAGPGGRLEFPLAGADEHERDTTFDPVVTTQVVSRYVPGGSYVDDVTFASARGAWGRTGDGGYLPVTATATLYRTETEPQLTDTPPADAEEVAALEATTDPAIGPTAPYRVESAEPLPGPGFYTAVWRIERSRQSHETAAALTADYTWQERFGVQSQITMVPQVSSKADALVAVGDRMSDEVIVAAPLPVSGILVTASVFRVPDGVAATDACTAENLVWQGPEEPVRVTEPGSVRVAGPVVPDFGTYVWRERATDIEGRLIHEGACGVESETTRAPLPTVSTRAVSTVGLGGEAVDTAVVEGLVPTSGTTWLSFEVFQAPEDVDPPEACTTETRVADTSASPVAVTAAGEYASPAVRLHGTGVHYWIESLWHTPEGGEARLLARGSCGLAEETTVVEQPAVTTRATEHVGVGDPYVDRATVTGLGEGVDAHLVFSVFHNEPGTAPRCDAETLEHRTAPVTVSGSGEYASPDVTSDEAGTKLWIAELAYRPSAGAKPVVLHTGTCGEEGETTFVDMLALSGGPSTRTVAGLGVGALALGFATASILAWRRHREQRR